jgi:protease PrsW
VTQQAGGRHVRPGNTSGYVTTRLGAAADAVTSVGRHLPWARQQRRRVFWPVLGMVIAAAGAMNVIGMATAGVSRGSVLAGTALALVPVVVVAMAFLWLDRWEPEPGGALLAAFLWGAGVATSAAIVVNTFVGENYGATTSAIVSAPVAEELLKGTFLVVLLWARRRELDGVLDGIVYAGLVAIGFAFVENILYLASAFEESTELGWTTFVLRGVFSPFAHPLFTVFIGIAVGLAARSTNTAVRLGLPFLGLAAAVGLHALWNASATRDGGSGFIPIYIAVMVPVFLGMIGIALWQRRRERRIVASYVPYFVDAGWVAPSEARLLSAMGGRRRWKAAVRQQSGSKAAAAVARYQTAVTELAFLADRMARGTAGPAAEQWHAELVATMTQARAAAVAAAKTA